MLKKKENTTKNSPSRPRSKKEKGFYVVSLPEYQKDLSHLMTPENERPEVEKRIRKIIDGEK